jgi:hypothetical protein
VAVKRLLFSQVASQAAAQRHQKKESLQQGPQVAYHLSKSFTSAVMVALKARNKTTRIGEKKFHSAQVSH